jgi:hypothetical protein
VERTGYLDYRVSPAGLVLNGQAQHVAIEFHGGIDIVHHLGNSRHVSDHGFLPALY